MEIVKIDINKIKPYENNVKNHPKEQIKQIMESIQEFGNNDPIAIDENYVIIEGHGRYEALKKLKYEEVECIILNGLTEEQKNAYRLVHNKLTMNSDFDLSGLEEELNKITQIDMSKYDFDLSDILNNGDEKEIIEDEPPEVPVEPKSKYGDIYQLGNHRLMCGDSTNKEDVDKLMLDKKAIMIFTDPPYLMNFEGNVHADGSKSYNAKFGKIKNDNMTKEQGDQFILKIFQMIKNYVVGSYYVCFYRLGLDYIFRALEKLNNKYKSLIIWNKGNHTLSNSDYMSKYEPIVYGWFNEHLFYGDRSNFDIWDIERTKKNDLHPTMKPVALCSHAILNSSKKNDIVLDLFGGSGSTLIACEQLNRNCYIMELDPKYVDVIIERWEKFTGQKAIKIN